MAISSSDRRRGLTAFALAGLLGICGSPALAACDNTDYTSKLDTYYAKDCLPADAKVRERAAAQSKKFFKDVTSPEAFISKALQAVERLEGEVAIHATQNAEGRKYFQKLQQYLGAAKQDLNALPSVDTLAIRPVDFPRLLPDFWRIDSTPQDQGSGLPATVLRDENCAAKAPGDDARCDAVFNTVIAVADDVYVATRLILDLHSEQRSRFIADGQMRTERWNAYLYDTQFQFWWELAFNRYQESRCPKGLTARLADAVNKRCHAQSKDSFGNLLGFRDVPDYRMTLLHPDLGAGYFEDEADGQKFKPLLVFQWIGFQWWDWDESSVSRLRGLALVSTVADTGISSRTGLGLQFQYGGLALAVTSHGGDIALTLNTGLVDNLGTVNAGWADKFRSAFE